MLISYAAFILFYFFFYCQVLDGIDNLIGVSAKALAGELPMQQTARNYTLPKDKLSKEHQDTATMGHTLLERLALPVLTFHGYVLVMIFENLC